MANRTDPAARSIKGTNSQNLVDKILRSRIYRSNYWKQQCFGLNAETLVDKAIELDHIGGTFGGSRKPTPFLCLVLKMLQIQPDKEIIIEFINNYDHKYVRVLGAFYLRLTGMDFDVYSYLEPLYEDFRKLRLKLQDGNFTFTHVDEVIDELLTGDYWCEIEFPRIKKRYTLEGIGLLEPRISDLEDDFAFKEEEEKKEDERLPDCVDSGDHDKDYYRGRSPERGRDRDRRRDGHRDYDRDDDYDMDRECDREGGRGLHRDRDRDRVRDTDRQCQRYDKKYNRDWERDREDRGLERRDRGRGGERSCSRSRSRSRD